MPSLPITMRGSSRARLVPPAGLVIVLAVAAAARGESREGEALFESKVRPLLVAKCQECHGAGVAEAGLRLDSRKGLLLGSDAGAVVVPGDAAKSRLVAAVKHVDELAMPPDAKLSDEEIAVLEEWVSVGVPWTGPGGEEAVAATREEAMQERIRESLASHWAFRAPERHEAPQPAAGGGITAEVAAAWSRSPIDRFVVADLAAAGLAPSPEATARDLFRRMHYDLTGLPPTAADADAFAADPSDDAYRAAVERLLASREHAEHWARHWLDLARYADTMGYALDQSRLYPFAWTYRDWVVRSLHDDLPYDRFVTLQLAADRIEPPVPRKDLAALGFLTVGRTFSGNQHDIIDDRIDLVGRGLMGLTISCARCHDHKYEPISTADYYALHGVFASCEVPQRLPTIGEPPPGPEAEAFAKTYAELDGKITEHEKAIYERAVREAVVHAADYFVEVARPAKRADGRLPQLADGYELHPLLVDRLGRLLGGAGADHPILGAWAAVKNLPDEKIVATLAEFFAIRPSAEPRKFNPLVAAEFASAAPASLRAVAEAYGRLVARVAPEIAGGPPAEAGESPDLAALREIFGREGSPLVLLRSEAMRVAKRSESDEHRRRSRALTNHEATAPGGPRRAMVLFDKPTPVDSPILLRGDPGRPGSPTSRRLPELLGGEALDRGSSGRLDLARAIVSSENPLTARLIVNWAWTHHFGHGLVATPGDFGLRGEPPTHGKLLDDLARRFVEDGKWSLRWLHREIVLSRTWRQSAAIHEDLVACDPENRLFGRAERRRLSWEAFRDSLLAAAGTLDRSRAGGPGIDPLDVTAMGSRSVYSQLDRQDVPGLLRSFDIANPDTSVHVRNRTTVPQQGLAVLNAPLVIEAARKLASRSAGEAGEPPSGATRIAAIWRDALARSPSDRERAFAEAWLAENSSVPAVDGFGPWERLAQAVLATAEFQYVD
jgi:cytochrome c553